MEKIFCIELIIKNPNTSFDSSKRIEFHQAWESGDIVWTLVQFQLALVKVLKEIQEKEIKEFEVHDDIPF